MKVEMALYILTQTMMHHMMRTVMVFQEEGTAGFFSLYVAQTLGVLSTAGGLGSQNPSQQQPTMH